MDNEARGRTRPAGPETDAVTLLRQESRRLEDLLARLSSDGDPRAVVAELADRLSDHVDVTEGIFYPTIRRRSQADALPDLLDAATRQHAELLGLLAELSGAGPDGEGARATLGKLEEQLSRHLEHEDTRVLPAAEELLDDDTLLDLGRRIQQRMQVLKAQHELMQMVSTARLRLARMLPAAASLGGLALAGRATRRNPRPAPRKARLRRRGRQP